MKITKLIREYVTEEVTKVYDAKVNPYTKYADVDRNNLKWFQQELRHKQKTMIEEFVSKNELFEKHYTGFEPYTICTTVPSFTWCYTKDMIDEKEWEEENTRQKNAKIREILLNLELGANRQELNEMIAKLMEE